MSTAEKIETADAAVNAEDGKAGLSFGGLEQSAGFVLRIAQLTAFERFFKVFPADNIKISEFTVLLAIAENPGVRQGVLADVLKIKWSNMTKLVRALEEKEWIGRHIPPHDRRSVELHVTAKGRRAIDAVAADMYASDREALAMLDDAEHRQLLVLLRKVAGWPPKPETEAEASA